ncbi:hypothetical protein F5144DRAFT_391176 [Chaetomium tenue]|uniref:Uncharacterized protein n=1 Tax=Chaetomium tenue TaxID=1854479 RepID=A0ACB7NYR9_9PEZI|nr:hypothetical protein F5144DRAFT_391176 [Chaetomium globosum]
MDTTCLIGQTTKGRDREFKDQGLTGSKSSSGAMISLWFKEPKDIFRDAWSSERALSDQQSGATRDVASSRTGAKL